MIISFDASAVSDFKVTILWCYKNTNINIILTIQNLMILVGL